jgi:predicted Rossmann fold nucleotide-binding protein DprA/Smf involved in DNA uptake
MQLSRDTQAVLLLTTYFSGGKGDAKPLGPTEWGDFAEWLRKQGGRPGELLNGSAESLLNHWQHPRVSGDRLSFLLGRGNALAMALEKWERAGIWIMTRGDQDYPTRLKQRLGKTAPPVFFGYGKRTLLKQGGLAIVGSRKATEDDLKATRMLAESVAAQGHNVVSGGARGVDEAAMTAALEAGGTVIGVLADSLLKAVGRNVYRKAIRSGDLALISPFQPEARFQVGNAMGRNKYIYCLADAGVVITCEEAKGGTWAGAKETLRQEWVPVWTRFSEQSAQGVVAMEALGARRLPQGDFTIRTLWDEAAVAAETHELPEEHSASVQAHVNTEDPAPYLENEQKPADVLFETFLDQIRPLISANPMSVPEIQEQTQLELAQVKVWLKKADQDGLIEAFKKRPLQYQWIGEQSTQVSLDL